MNPSERLRLIELRSFDNRWLKGVLTIPSQAAGGIVLVDGTASGRLKEFLTSLAKQFVTHQLATLVVDLLTDDESFIEDKKFDIELLSARVQAAADGLSRELKTPGLKLGYFGVEVGAAAVTVAAAQRKTLVGGVVCYGETTTLAENYRSRVQAPLLNIDIVEGDTSASVVQTAAPWLLNHLRPVQHRIL